VSLTYDQAAEALNLPKSWLQKHIDSLPHQKYGHYVRFEPSDLDAIRAMHRHVPPAEGAALYVLRQQADTRTTRRKQAA
jgi:hypothetical protein